MPPRYKPAAHYLLTRARDGHVLGRVRRGVYQAADSEPCAQEPYTGIVEHSGEVLRIRLRYGGYLLIDDPQQVAGERLQLRQIVRPPADCGLDDPDVYRALRDLMVYLGEVGHPRAPLFAAQVSAAPFDPCPGCDDHYGAAELCAICAGRGFVPEV